MYNRLEFTFQPVIFLPRLSGEAHETGYKAEMGHGFPMDALAETATQISPSDRDTASR